MYQDEITEITDNATIEELEDLELVDLDEVQEDEITEDQEDEITECEDCTPVTIYFNNVMYDRLNQVAINSKQSIQKVIEVMAAIQFSDELFKGEDPVFGEDQVF